MVETIANATVELAKVAVMGYVVHVAGQLGKEWLKRVPMQPTDEQIVDAARLAGFEVRA